MPIVSTAGIRFAGIIALLTAFAVCTGTAALASGMAVPLPPSKPLGIERTYIPAPAGTIPVPAPKQNFGRPDVMQLLQFGQPPRPKAKPVRDSGQPLSTGDAALYKKVFSWQSQARWDKADALMNQLNDYRLRGHVLYQRYVHPTAYHATFDELANWLNIYADHPGAERIYKMATARMPKGFTGSLHKPAHNSRMSGFIDVLDDQGRTYVSPRKRTETQRKEVANLSRAVRSDVTRSAPSRALDRLLGGNTSKLLDTVEYDQLQAQIAGSYMYEGKTKKALELALASARRSGNAVPDAGWIGGLCAWREKNYKTAASLFELTATSPYTSTWMQAAGAYWASRAHMRAGNMPEVNKWLEQAAKQPRTFYGLIATRALGWDFDFNWAMPELTPAHMERLKKLPEARRAMALVAAGQYHLAEEELRQINPAGDKQMLEALLAYANQNALPSYAMRLAEAVPNPDGGLYDAALYPLSPWNPNGGFKVDRALIYALIRQESRFNPAAESRSGAAGLMQLMPATASFVAGNGKYRGAEGKHSLKDPQVNLDIGQRYVENLLDETHVSTELFSLVIAYNAGPGNLRKWKTELANLSDDPLLFVESIPMGETRNFVERVMSNYWIYRLRMDQPASTLDAVAEGRWALYVPMDGVKQADASPLPKHFN